MSRTGKELAWIHGDKMVSLARRAATLSPVVDSSILTILFAWFAATDAMSGRPLACLISAAAAISAAWQAAMSLRLRSEARALLRDIDGTSRENG